MTTLHGDPSRVRIADEADAPEILAMCKSLHEENGLFPLSETKVRATIDRALCTPMESRIGLIGVVGERGHLQGSVYLEVGPLWYSDVWTLGELWSYVYPKFRSSSNSRDLIAFAKSMADQFGLPLMIGVLSNIRTEAKVRLYRKELGAPAGAFFVHGAHAPANKVA